LVIICWLLLQVRPGRGAPVRKQLVFAASAIIHNLLLVTVHYLLYTMQ